MDTKQTKRVTSRSRSAQTGKENAKKRSTKRTAGGIAKRQTQQRRKPATSGRNGAGSTLMARRTDTGSHGNRRTAPSQPAPEVVYTPAKPFNRGRFVLHLATVVAVVLALSFGISIFFKVEIITVTGAEKYDAWTVKEASGIEIGDNLLSFGEAKAAGKIKTALPYVEQVRIGIKLPDTVNIEIKELDVVYCIKDAVEQWWMITSEGRVVDKADSATAGSYTQIRGVKLATPVSGQQATAHEEQLEASDDTTGPTAATMAVKACDRLAAALSILQYLEECGIIGEAASVDVTDLGNLELQYGQRFLVKLGDTNQLLYKIKCMNAAINGEDEENALKDYDSGVLDISFTIKENQIIYQAYE